MAEDFDVKIPVDMDNRGVKASEARLEQAKRKGQRKQNRIVTLGRNAGGKIKGRVTALAGGVGGYSAVRRLSNSMSASTSEVDPWMFALTPYTSAFNQAIDSVIGYSAGARASAREMTRTAFAETADVTGSRQVVQQFFQTANVITQEEERGRHILRQDPALAGPGLGDLIADALEGYVQLIGDSFNYLIDRFNPF